MNLRLCRALTVLGLTLLIGLPLGWTAAALDPHAPFRFSPGLLSLARNSLVLTLGTVLLALPTGTLLAFLLERTDLPGRRWWLGLFLLPVFVPLPLFAAGWQAALGAGGLMTLAAWSGAGTWAPWAQGLVPAIWIHAVAGVPWVVLFVGHGLRRVAPELEEEALLTGGGTWCLWRVTLPQSIPSLVAAGLWLALVAWTEISITDIVQVRTFAEEVYTQLVGPERGEHDPLSSAVIVSLPGTTLAVFLLLVLAWWWERSAVPPTGSLRPAAVFSLGRWRVPTLLFLFIIASVLLGLPMAGLIRRAGVQGPEPWSPSVLVAQLHRAIRLQGWHLMANLSIALVAGMATAGIALVVSWLGRDSWPFRLLVALFAALACAVPGPLLGLGMKSLILDSLLLLPFPPLEWALWHGPSYLPLVWVDLIRFFPVALAITWPVARSWPAEWFEEARLDGVGGWGEWRMIVWPQGRAVWGRSTLAVAILALGELSAGKLVSTPGAAGYAEMVFAQLHYGMSADLAGQCLLLLLVVAGGGIGLLASRGWCLGR